MTWHFWNQVVDNICFWKRQNLCSMKMCENLSHRYFQMLSSTSSDTRESVVRFMTSLLNISWIWASGLLQMRKWRGILQDANSSAMSVRKVFWSWLELHLSKVSTIMRFFAGRNPGSSQRSNLKACMKSLWNWTVMDLMWIECSAYNIDSRYGCILGMDITSCHASVRNSQSKTLWSDVFLWKKKDAASCVSWKLSAMVWVMADSPALVGLLSQKICWIWVICNLLQSVPGWHCRGTQCALETWEASSEMNFWGFPSYGRFLRMVEKAV